MTTATFRRILSDKLSLLADELQILASVHEGVSVGRDHLLYADSRLYLHIPV